MTFIPRSEYPRPNFVRENWMTLNGPWEFSFDEERYDKQIIVPYAYQTKLSGIGSKEFHEIVWYKKEVQLPKGMMDKQVLLHFGAVDYECRVWVNNHMVGSHIGGQTSFSFNITEALHKKGLNIIRVEVKDYPQDLEIPRGKQFWEKQSRSVFYTPTTGIWQSVWLEAVSDTYIKDVLITPVFDERSVKVEYELEKAQGSILEIDITYKEVLVNQFGLQVGSNRGSVTVQLDQAKLNSWNFHEDLAWTPENPRLFGISFRLKIEDEITDQVESYFGMRKVSVEDGVFLLNNQPYYQKLILDQGYWEESLLTAPTDEDFIKDIQLTKQMGFNGVRKHQKVEDPRYLYHADRLGLLVWGEIGAAYTYSRQYVKRITDEWMDVVLRDYNHPCIVAWTPLNESWGVQEISHNSMQQAHCNSLYYLTKSLDSTRLVIENDGWEHTYGDLFTIHDYESREQILRGRYESLDSTLSAIPAGRALYAKGWKYKGQPILMTEFGGISYRADDKSIDGWGYSAASSHDDFLQRYQAVIRPILESPVIQGFCYTQLADVEQEINGLLTYARMPKAELGEIKKINEGKWFD